MLVNSVFSIIFARIWYAINWFNIAAIFYLIIVEFEQNISMLGFIMTSFLMGIGSFQIIVGILATKYDLRILLIFGTILLSVSSFLSGFVFEAYQMAILRFLVGVGMAFFFAPSVILISKYLGKGTEGLGIGLLNSAHSLGGLIGIFVWIIIAEDIGWRFSLIVSGGAGIISSIFLIYTLYKNNNTDICYSIRNASEGIKYLNPISHLKQKLHRKNSNEIKIISSEIKSILLNKSIILIGLSLLGTQIGWNIIFTFTVFFLKSHLFLEASMSGLIASIPMIFNVIFAPLFGGFYDKINKKNNNNNIPKFLFLCSIILSTSIALFALSNIYIIIISIILIGIFASGGFVIPYSLARQISVKKLNQSKYETLAVSYVNGLSLIGGFWVPALFTLLVQNYGYSTGWIIGGLLTFVFIIPILKLKMKI